MQVLRLVFPGSRSGSSAKVSSAGEPPLQSLGSAGSPVGAPGTGGQRLGPCPPGFRVGNLGGDSVWTQQLLLICSQSATRQMRCPCDLPASVSVGTGLPRAQGWECKTKWPPRETRLVSLPSSALTQEEAGEIAGVSSTRVQREKLGLWGARLLPPLGTILMPPDPRGDASCQKSHHHYCLLSTGEGQNIEALSGNPSLPLFPFGVL